MAEERTFKASALDCVLVGDGQLPHPPAALFANAPVDELERALVGEIDADGMIVGRFNPLLVRGPRALVLVDAGFGRLAPGPGRDGCRSRFASRASPPQMSMSSS